MNKTLTGVNITSASIGARTPSPGHTVEAGTTPSIHPLTSATLPLGGAELDSASVALLQELARSLHAGQQALLSRDLLSLELNTQTQHRLCQALEILWTQKAATPSSYRPGSPNGPDGALAVRLRAAQWQVLQLGRVQAALLIRAQRSLRMIVHLRAGLEATYSAPHLPLGADRQEASSGSSRRRP